MDKVNKDGGLFGLIGSAVKNFLNGNSININYDGKDKKVEISSEMKDEKFSIKIDKNK